MEHYRNKEVRKYIALFLFCSVATMLFMGIITYLQCQNYRKTENIAIKSIFYEVVRENPDTDIDKLMSIFETPDEYWYKLSEKEKAEVEQILSRYGASQKDYTLVEMEKMEGKMILYNVLMTLGIQGVLLCIFLCYLRKRSQKLLELSGYMDMVAQGRYQLEMADNSEDELSNLKNQLYKITVTMKELAIQSKMQKEALADSVSDISHQLKTPLTSASILLDNLNDNEDMDEETRKRFIHEISKQVFSMNWMIIAMLKLSRLDAGVVELEQKKYSVDQIIHEAIENLEIIAELKNVQLELIGMDEVELVGDKNWNREAVQNILKNAIEHSQEESMVTIKLEDNSVYTAIHITNFGDRITKEQQKMIFERHYSAAQPDSQSFGIGLPLAKAIVEKQNGYLSVDSDETSTTFILKYRK